MRLKLGVDDTQLSPVLGLWLGVLARHHREWTGEEFVVTSLRRESNGRASRHVVKPGELVTAADFRRHLLDELDLAEPFCRMIQSVYKSWLVVVLEPEWLTEDELEQRGGALKVEPHVHIQLHSGEWPQGIL